MKHYKLNGVDYRASATCAEFKQRANSEWETSLFDNESELIENGAVLVDADKAAHSPTQWVANGVKITVANDPTICERLITEVCGECAGTQDRANAAHIVRCVNAHEDLLEACRFALEAISCTCNPSKSAPALHCDCITCDAANKLTAAINKATT